MQRNDLSRKWLLLRNWILEKLARKKELKNVQPKKTMMWKLRGETTLQEGQFCQLDLEVWPIGTGKWIGEGKVATASQLEWIIWRSFQNANWWTATSLGLDKRVESKGGWSGKPVEFGDIWICRLIPSFDDHLLSEPLISSNGVWRGSSGVQQGGRREGDWPESEETVRPHSLKSSVRLRWGYNKGHTVNLHQKGDIGTQGTQWICDIGTQGHTMNLHQKGDIGRNWNERWGYKRWRTLAHFGVEMLPMWKWGFEAMTSDNTHEEHWVHPAHLSGIHNNRYA